MRAIILWSPVSSSSTPRLSSSLTSLLTRSMPSSTPVSVTDLGTPAAARPMPRLHAKAFTGSAIVLIFITVGIVGPRIAPHDPNKQELTAMTRAPEGMGSAHVLGTDNLGRDIF